MTVFLKDPDSTVDYQVDWSDYLAEDSPADTISTSTWFISPSTSPGLTSSNESKTDSTTTAFFSGGIRKTVYRATNRIVTTGGRTEDRSVVIRVGQR